MTPIGIAIRNLRTRLGQTLLTAVVIALGVGLALGVIVLSAGLKRGLIVAGGPFEIVVGPKGSATQLVVSSVLLQDLPIGNLSYAQYEQVRADERIRDAIPIALGDNVGGLRIVGTTPELFAVAVTPAQGPFYAFATGRPFAADFEAVLGNTAAQQLGLSVGAEFMSGHGVIGGIAGEAHEGEYYRVVGILAPTDSPADLGVYVPLSSYWRVHAPFTGSIFAPAELPAAFAALTPDEQRTLGVTAVLVRARTISASYQVYQAYNSGPELQAALPGLVLTQFLDLLGQGQRVLALVTYVALGMAALSVALTLYGAVLARQRDIAVLRALGARRSTVLLIAVCEAAMLAVLGIVLGLFLGHAIAGEIAARVAARSALAVPLRFELAELWVVFAMFALGIGGGVLPAIRAYRLEAASVLAGV